MSFNNIFPYEQVGVGVGVGLAESTLSFDATKSGTRMDPHFHRSTQDTSRSGIMDCLEKREIIIEGEI